MEGLVEESEGHVVVAALTEPPLSQPGGIRKNSRSALLATLMFRLIVIMKNRNGQMQRGDVALEVLRLGFQLVQFFGVLLVLILQFKRLSVTIEKTYKKKKILKQNEGIAWHRSSGRI